MIERSIHAWERRLAGVDTNRAVLPFDWGLEWLGRNPASPDPAAERARLVADYQDRFANPYIAAGRGYVDDVIMPSETRPRLIAALDLLADKRDVNPPKKHGNIPL